MSDSDEFQDLEGTKARRKTRHGKRRRALTGYAIQPPDESETVRTAFDSLFERLDPQNRPDYFFEDIINDLLPDYLRTRAVLQEQFIETDQKGNRVRPLTRSEVSSFIQTIDAQDGAKPPLINLIRRKLKLAQERRRNHLSDPQIRTSDIVTPLTSLPVKHAPQSQVIEALSAIQTTPYENSFLSRIQGTRAGQSSASLAVDWETVTPWMSLIADIREHHRYAHPEREQPLETLAPIIYTSLQACHLDQVHNLLERSFWPGINVSDSLDHFPERCTVVATYKHLVVGVAILSSPRETYITYLAVKAGWDNARIARSMLYHLIMLNPDKDITLHVSVNNPAMLLYNQFGFKAEEFVAGFYENYLEPHSRRSKNAFRLRLRQQ